MKQILVEVRPNSKQLKIEKITATVYKIHLTAPARDNKANHQLIEVLAEHFNTAKSLITIKAGATSKTKVVLLDG